MDTKQIARLKITGKVFQYTVNFFHEQGFTQLMPVMLGKSVDPLGPDPGSSVVKIPEIEYQNEKFKLMTSMILHKQIAIQEGLKKIFIMSPNIRLEKSDRNETGKHAFEFTQADFEIANAKMIDVFNLVENYYSGLSQYMQMHAKKQFAELDVEIFEFKTPFNRYNTQGLEKQLGYDWEDKISKRNLQPSWVINHQREFYDKEDPNKPGIFLNYDLIYPKGFGEGLSGAEREYEYKQIIRRIGNDGLKIKSYESYLKYAKKGFVPSAGAGIGIERLARFLTRTSHIQDVQLFKRIPGIPVLI